MHAPAFPPARFYMVLFSYMRAYLIYLAWHNASLFPAHLPKMRIAKLSNLCRWVGRYVYNYLG